MNFGYLLIVSQSEHADYLSLAYALALSIKNTQKEGYDKVALVIDDKSELERIESKWVFDSVIEWNQETFWDGRSWMDKLTPFENTVCLDVDMLFFRDYSHWIDYFVENSELYIPHKAFTYRDEIIVSNEYRKTFVENDLPNLYSMYTFFKKDSKLAEEFFSLGRYIIKHPGEFSNLYLTNHKPKILGTDEAFALSAKILDIQDEISYDLDFPKIVHMKSMVQNWPCVSEDWTDHVGFYFNRNSELKIGNFYQDSIVHYVKKNKIDREVLSILEEKAWKN